MDGVVDSVKQLDDLVDAEERVGVEDERDDDFGGSECASSERSVARVGERVPAVGTVAELCPVSCTARTDRIQRGLFRYLRGWV